MAVHLAAYSVTSVADTMTNMAGLVDQVLTRAQTSGVYVFQTRLNLIAALGMGATLSRVQVTSPTLRQVGVMNFRPINLALQPVTDVQVCWLGDQPISLPAMEEIQPACLDTAAEVVVFAVWLADSIIPVPAGQIINVRATSTTPAVANVWTVLTMTMDNALPAGRYAIVGSECISTTGKLHRFIIPGQLFRPGQLSGLLLGNRGDPRLLSRRLGSYGTFVNTAMPQIEVLCTAADAAHEIYMQLIPLDFRLNEPMSL